MFAPSSPLSLPQFEYSGCLISMDGFISDLKHRMFEPVIKKFVSKGGFGYGKWQNVIYF